MNDVPAREEQRRYVRIWDENRNILEKIRDQEIREAGTATSIQMFEQA